MVAMDRGSVRVLLCRDFPFGILHGSHISPCHWSVMPVISTAGRAIGFLSSLNTLGGIAASLTAAFLLIPAAGIQGSLAIVAIINCSGGLAVMAWGKRVSRGRIAACALVSLLLCFVCLTFSSRHPMVLYSRAGPRHDFPVSLVSYKEDQTASVAILKTTVAVRLISTASTLQDLPLRVHAPACPSANHASPSPDTVMVVCLGTGTTCGTAALYPKVKRVDCAEYSRRQSLLRRNIFLMSITMSGAIRSPHHCQRRANHLRAPAALERHYARTHAPISGIGDHPLFRRLLPALPRAAFGTRRHGPMGAHACAVAARIPHAYRKLCFGVSPHVALVPRHRRGAHRHYGFITYFCRCIEAEYIIGCREGRCNEDIAGYP